MKKLLIILFTLGIVVAASAQRHGGYYSRPRVIVGVGAYYPYAPFGFYSPFYPYPGYYNNSYHRPSKLEVKLEDIRSDYRDRIWSAKHDTALTRKDRRQKVRELKHERDRVLADTKMNYYKTPR
jgi:hypothetical protein